MKSQSSPTLPAQEKLFVAVKRFWRASSSTACSAGVRANPLTLTWLSIPIPSDEQSAAAAIPPSHVLGTRPRSHGGRNPTPAAQGASNQGLALLTVCSQLQGNGNKGNGASCRTGQQSFLPCWKPRAATPVTGMGGLFCFIATEKEARPGSPAQKVLQAKR